MIQQIKVLWEELFFDKRVLKHFMVKDCHDLLFAMAQNSERGFLAIRVANKSASRLY